MDRLITAALAKELEKLAKEGRDELPVGTHEVSATVTLHVEGTVKVGADGTYTPTTSIPMKAAFALFMRYSGITGPAAMDALTRAMTEALTLGKDAEATLAELADLEAAEAKVRAGLDALPAQTRKGAVAVKATVSETAEVANEAPVRKAG